MEDDVCSVGNSVRILVGLCGGKRSLLAAEKLKEADGRMGGWERTKGKRAQEGEEGGWGERKIIIATLPKYKSSDRSANAA
eukprot:748038-Hanusia_phi.AAC.2